MTATPNVFIRDGAVFTNSRDVAAHFQKRHDNVLRDIDNLLELLATQNRGAENPMLHLVMFTDPTQPGREFRSFDMTRDGFTLLAMGFTGQKALRFKLAYIEAFNAMAAALKQEAPAPQSAIRRDYYVFGRSGAAMINLDLAEAFLGRAELRVLACMRASETKAGKVPGDPAVIAQATGLSVGTVRRVTYLLLSIGLLNTTYRQGFRLVPADHEEVGHQLMNGVAAMAPAQAAAGCLLG